MKSLLDHRIKLPLLAFLVVGLCLALEHFTGGVVTHHLLARDDMPGVSNYWGLVSVPLLAFVVAYVIHRNRYKKTTSEEKLKQHEDVVFKRFIAALAFGITISLLWELRLESVLPYLILLPLLLAFFRPVHYPECLLGFVLGMVYTFGGILPILIGTVLLIIAYLINRIIRLLKRVFVPKA
ncbi:MAG: hypothetical protein HKN53_09140 [Maribacter sp.]|nr:hypothetical protein [Maribacter sp.]